MVIKKKIISVDSNSNNTLFALRVNCDEFSFIDILQNELNSSQFTRNANNV